MGCGYGRQLIGALLLACTAALPGAACAEAASAPAAAASSPLQLQLEAIRRLQAQRPGDGLLVYYEAMTLARLGERALALEQLRALAGRRLGLVPVRGLFESLWDDADFQALRLQLWEEEPRTPEAPAVHRLQDARLIPEGIAWDARRGVHYLGSIARRKVVKVDRAGRVRDLSRPGDDLEAVLGLALDARRDRLCAVSTNGFEAAGAGMPRNAVVCWNLATRRVSARADFAEARQLNDLAFTPDGSLFVTDSAEGSLWRWTLGTRPVRVGAAGALRGANGVAVAPGAVYVALSTGIARVDPATGALERLPQPDDALTGGIDGLYWDEGALLGVQNVPNPGRVIRLALDEAGRRITGVHVLQSHHHPDFAEPTTGALVGRHLHVIANSHVEHYQPDRSLRDVQALRGTVIVAVPTRPATRGTPVRAPADRATRASG